MYFTQQDTLNLYVKAVSSDIKNIITKIEGDNLLID